MIDITLNQYSGLPEERQFDTIENWVVLFPERAQKNASTMPYLDTIRARFAQLNSKTATPITLDLPNKCISHLSCAYIEPTLTSFALLTLARKLIAAHNRFNPTRLGLVVTGFATDDAEHIAEALISATLAAHSSLPEFKSKKSKKRRLRRLLLFGVQSKDCFRKSFAEQEGNALARGLSMLPGNILTPADYLQRVKKISKENGWKMRFFDMTALKRKGAGAFLAVAQGSASDDAGIIRLQYQPKKNTVKNSIALVGKGICYDTGGTNLKPARAMFGMHEDMQGSAVALGVLLALTRMQYQRPVTCWLALAMNHIGARAYKPNDVITAADGSTIEIVDTDAEGRMVLADTLTLAVREEPVLMIDFATLTGACIDALGTAYSGIFTNRPAWLSTLIKIGRDCGERVWPFPLDEDFDELLSSTIADIKQCASENGVDHILAARFLQRFTKDAAAWIHIDLSSSSRKGGLAHIPTDTTGFGVRYTVNLLHDETLLADVSDTG